MLSDIVNSDESGRISGWVNKFVSLIPGKTDPCARQKSADLTRKRKLPFSKLTVFVLSIVANGKSRGIALHLCA